MSFTEYDKLTVTAPFVRGGAAEPGYSLGLLRRQVLKQPAALITEQVS